MRMHSIKVSILFIILPIILVVMAVLSMLGYTTARKSILDSINREMELSLSTAVENIEKSLMNNGKVAETMARGVENLTSRMERDDYGKLLTSFVATNDETFGGGIWFQPYAFEPGERYFSPYCMRENGQVVYVDNYNLGEGVYYTDQDWYTSAVNTNESIVWSAPYYDEYAKISMVTATAPFYDAGGNLMGVTTTDIDLTELQKMVASLQIHDTGRAFLIDGAGTYIADEDSAKLLSVQIQQDPNASLAALGEQIISGRTGTGSYEVDGASYLAWYDVVPESDWIIVTTIAERDLMSGVTGLAQELVIICVLAALLVSALLFIILDIMIVKPLGKLARVTGRIAEGDLSVSVDYRSNNEIGRVFHSIEKTVDRLSNYIQYIDEVSAVLTQVADGELAFTLQHDYSGEFAKLKTALLQIQGALLQTIQEIVEVSGHVSNHSHEISAVTSALSQGSVEQNNSVEEISQNVGHIRALISGSSTQLESASTRSTAILEEITKDNQKMQEMTTAMSEISGSSAEIGKIIKTVEDIAFQTNILALNAAVEAARAGAAGKGFAVVADEVRNLANKSQEAAKNTAMLIQGSMSTVARGMRIAQETAEAMSKVVADVEETARIIRAITASSSEQVQFIEGIDTEVGRVTYVVQNNSAKSQETAAKCAELFEESKRLLAAAAQFHLEEEQPKAGRM